MRSAAAIGLALATLTFTPIAQAQTFDNLDFENAKVQSNDPIFGFLPWDLAVPRWTHGEGPDSGIVYLGLHHVGLTPWYQLVDAGTQGMAPLQGSYSLAFANGHADAQSEQSGWIESFIAQSGLVGANARSVRFQAIGQVEVRVNGVAQTLHALDGNAYAVDITAYPGQIVELSFVNKSATLHDPVMLDAITVSTAAVPEPSTWSTLLVGLGMAGLQARRQALRA